MIQCVFENGKKAYLRDVVVDALVLKDNKILLVKRNRKLSEGGKWGLAGGYVDRNETVLQAVEREIFEETGWQVEKITFLKVVDNPNRRHEERQNIALVFFCQAKSQKGKGDWETEDQQWFSFDQLPPDNQIAFDHREMIHDYLSYLKNPKKLQIIK